MYKRGQSTLYNFKPPKKTPAARRTFSKSDFDWDVQGIQKTTASASVSESNEGSQYQATKNLPLKVVAQRIKAEIQRKYPGISVSVGTQHYSGGCSVNIKVNSWKGRHVMVEEVDAYGFKRYPYTPEAKALLDGIETIADQYNRSSFDVDYSDQRFHCTPEFSWDLRAKDEKEFGLLK